VERIFEGECVENTETVVGSDRETPLVLVEAYEENFFLGDLGG
jgi:hypothetical protein